MRRYQALQHLRWGDGHIAPGEEVPAGDKSRNYRQMERTGQIARVEDLARVNPEAANARIAELEAQLEAANEQIHALTQGGTPPADGTGGEEPGAETKDAARDGTEPSTEGKQEATAPAAAKTPAKPRKRAAKAPRKD